VPTKPRRMPANVHFFCFDYERCQNCFVFIHYDLQTSFLQTELIKGKTVLASFIIETRFLLIRYGLWLVDCRKSDAQRDSSPSSHNPQDDNAYTLGEIFGHNIVVACLPLGVYATISAAKEDRKDKRCHTTFSNYDKGCAANRLHLAQKILGVRFLGTLLRV
jgi:hypothetical protein